MDWYRSAIASLVAATLAAPAWAQTPATYIWSEGRWGRVIEEQDQPARWVALESSDFLRWTQPAERAPVRARSESFSFTPRASRTSARDASFGIQLDKGKFAFAGNYLQRAPREDAHKDATSLRVYNLTASWQITPSTRLGIGYNRGERAKQNLSDASLANAQLYESMMLGGTTRLKIGRQSIDLGYFYQSGSDTQRDNTAQRLFQEDYTGLLMNWQF